MRSDLGTTASSPFHSPVVIANSLNPGVIAANKYTGVYNDRWKGDDEWYLTPYDWALSPGTQLELLANSSLFPASSQANFFRQVRNFIIDIRDAEPENMKGMHCTFHQSVEIPAGMAGLTLCDG